MNQIHFLGVQMIRPEILESAAPWITKIVVVTLGAFGSVFAASMVQSAKSIAQAIAKRNGKQVDLALMALKEKLTDRPASAEYVSNSFSIEFNHSLNKDGERDFKNPGAAVGALRTESLDDEQREAKAINNVIATINH